MRLPYARQLEADNCSSQQSLLQEVVGLRTLPQCRRVADALLAAARSTTTGVSLCVEGNISAGKSTFLQEIQAELCLEQAIEVGPHAYTVQAGAVATTFS